MKKPPRRSYGVCQRVLQTRKPSCFPQMARGRLRLPTLFHRAATMRLFPVARHPVAEMTQGNDARNHVTLSIAHNLLYRDCHWIVT